MKCLVTVRRVANKHAKEETHGYNRVSTTNVFVKKHLVATKRFFVQHPCVKTLATAMHFRGKDPWVEMFSGL
jgi:hypothetical protein